MTFQLFEVSLRGQRWSHTKGGDRPRVEALRPILCGAWHGLPRRSHGKLRRLRPHRRLQSCPTTTIGTVHVARHPQNRLPSPKRKEAGHSQLSPCAGFASGFAAVRFVPAWKELFWVWANYVAKSVLFRCTCAVLVRYLCVRSTWAPTQLRVSIFPIQNIRACPRMVDLGTLSTCHLRALHGCIAACAPLCSDAVAFSLGLSGEALQRFSSIETASLNPSG